MSTPSSRIPPPPLSIVQDASRWTDRLFLKPAQTDQVNLGDVARELLPLGMKGILEYLNYINTPEMRERKLRSDIDLRTPHDIPEEERQLIIDREVNAIKSGHGILRPRTTSLIEEIVPLNIRREIRPSTLQRESLIGEVISPILKEAIEDPLSNIGLASSIGPLGPLVPKITPTVSKGANILDDILKQADDAPQLKNLLDNIANRADQPTKNLLDEVLALHDDLESLQSLIDLNKMGVSPAKLESLTGKKWKLSSVPGYLTIEGGGLIIGNPYADKLYIGIFDDEFTSKPVNSIEEAITEFKKHGMIDVDVPSTTEFKWSSLTVDDLFTETVPVSQTIPTTPTIKGAPPQPSLPSNLPTNNSLIHIDDLSKSSFGPGQISELNGIPFTSWTDAPTPPNKVYGKEDTNDDIEKWMNVEGVNLNVLNNEPDFNIPSGNKNPASGVVIMEPDGRVWVMEPTGHFAGTQHTFPKGKKADYLTLQENAIKEAYEETGLKVEIVDFIADIEHETSKVRYYLAKRTGGTPIDKGWESYAVKLVPTEYLSKYLNKKPANAFGIVVNEHKQEFINKINADFDIEDIYAEQHVTLPSVSGYEPTPLTIGKKISIVIETGASLEDIKKEMVNNPDFTDSNNDLLDENTVSGLIKAHSSGLVISKLEDLTNLEWKPVGFSSSDQVITEVNNNKFYVSPLPNGKFYLIGIMVLTEQSFAVEKNSLEEVADHINNITTTQTPTTQTTGYKLSNSAINKLKNEVSLDWVPVHNQPNTISAEYYVGNDWRLIFVKRLPDGNYNLSILDQDGHWMHNTDYIGLPILIDDLNSWIQGSNVTAAPTLTVQPSITPGKLYQKQLQSQPTTASPTLYGPGGLYTTTHIRPNKSEVLGKKVTGLPTGSNVGGWVEGEGIYKGKNIYWKFNVNPNNITYDPVKARTEHLGNEIYRNYSDYERRAPETFLWRDEESGEIGFGSIQETGLHSIHSANDITPKAAKDFLKNAYLDLLLANYDVISYNWTNVLAYPGNDKVMRIDQGSSLLYRGMAGRKPRHTLDNLDAWDIFPTSPGYKEMMERAGVKSFDELGSQIYENINSLPDNWSSFVLRILPDWIDPERDDVINILNNRTRLLKERAREIPKNFFINDSLKLKVENGQPWIGKNWPEWHKFLKANNGIDTNFYKTYKKLLKNRDPEAEEVFKTIGSWTNSSIDIKGTISDLLQIYVGIYRGRSSYREGAKAIINAIHREYNNSPMLWRGINSDPVGVDEIKNLQVGDVFDYIPSSFSSRRNVAEGWAVSRYIIELIPNSRGLKIDNISGHHEYEWISGGEFEVIGIRPEGIYKIITVRQRRTYNVP